MVSNVVDDEALAVAAAASEDEFDDSAFVSLSDFLSWVLTFDLDLFLWRNISEKMRPILVKLMTFVKSTLLDAEQITNA